MMIHGKGKYLMLLLVAGLTTGAIESKELSPPPLDVEEYLDADDWFQAGLTFNSEGKYSEAAEAFSRSISISPNNPLSWLNLGTAEALTGNHDRAIEALKKAARLDPKLALAFANLAEVCFKDYRYQEAVEAYTSLLALWPRNPNALFKRGLAYLQLHDRGKAQAEYQALQTVDQGLAEKLLQAINQDRSH